VASYFSHHGFVNDTGEMIGLNGKCIESNEYIKMEKWLDLIGSHSLFQSKHVRRLKWRHAFRYESFPEQRIIADGYLDKIMRLSITLPNFISKDRLTEMLRFMTPSSLKSMRVEVMCWSHVKDVVVQLVNRSSFKRLELAFGAFEDYKDLLPTIKSNTNLRLKLKALEQDYQIDPHYRVCNNQSGLWWNKTMTDGHQFFLRLMSAAQDLECFHLDLTPLQDLLHPKPPLLTSPEWKFGKLKRFYCRSHLSYESGLAFILPKCGTTLKHLKIASVCFGSVSHPIDEILALCPKLLTFEIERQGEGYAFITIGDTASSPESSSKRYSLRFINGMAYDVDVVKSWLNAHCPRARWQISP